MATATAPGSADARPSDLTTFTIKVEGEKIPDTISVVTVDISRAIDRIPSAHLLLNDGDAAEQTFETSSSDLLAPGKTIEIEGGYSSDEEPLFQGIITQQQIQVRRKGGSLLTIEARDAAFRMTLGRRSRYYSDVKDSDLLEEVFGDYSDLTAEVEATTAVHPEIVQYATSDWDFVIARAQRIGMVCSCRNGTITVRKPSSTAAPARTLSYGGGIFDLDLRLDARTQYESISAAAWDPSNQEVVDANAEDVPAPAHGSRKGPDIAEAAGIGGYELRHTGALRQNDLDAWVEAGMLRSRFAKIRGTVRFQGNPEIQPGDLVRLEGLGERFNGTVFVSGVRHTLGAGDWETTVQVGLDPCWHHERYPIAAPRASGFSPPIAGLQIGLVSQLQDDPDGEDRVQVRLPMISPDEAGTWARLATLDAGEERGTVFRPEIDDEVVVGFLNDDPNEAIVLGMLHSSAKPAPIAASDENHEKGFVTRSGMKIVFNDDEPSILIDTPNGNQVHIHDGDGKILVKDESDNSITLDSAGISLESGADIVIKASGDVKVEGTNVELKGSSFKAEGSGSAELSSGGSTDVKGSIVNIN